ncbi:MAG: 2TM domain-containing protein [Actinobacteria bacterium]|nr:2TM domain-containing protein [Actinomycetota bacterium]
MHDDPFARAVERVQAAEQAEAADKRRRRNARLTDGSRKAFRIHATVYFMVNLLLVAIWLTVWQFNDGTSYPWFIWPLLGWGIGLAAHYAAVRDHLARPAKRPPDQPPV